MKTWKNDPVLFAEKFFGWKAHEGQKQILRSKAQILTVCAGRRFGKSEAMAIQSIFFAFKNPETIQFIIAPTYDQARVIFETVVKFVSNSVFANLIKQVKYSPYPIIQFVFGSEIHARSSEKYHNLRGRKAHQVILDEASFIKDEAVYEVIEPMLADYNGRMIKIGTPYGKNHFWESFEKGIRGEVGYESFKFPSWVNPYISHEFLEAKKKEYGETSLRWKVEYMAEFVDDSDTVFPWSVIENIIEDYEFPLPYQSTKTYFMGVDVAKYSDYTVISVLDDEGRLAYFERFNKTSWQYVVNRIEHVYKQYNALIQIDATGVGDVILEMLQERNIPVMPYVFTNASKVQLIEKLRGKMESREIIIPQLNELITELKFFEYEITNSHTIKMNARYGFNDDCVISLALAVDLFDKANVNIVTLKPEHKAHVRW